MEQMGLWYPFQKNVSVDFEGWPPLTCHNSILILWGFFNIYLIFIWLWQVLVVALRSSIVAYSI